jgi:predicted site-specific integrase-resolvase
LSTVTQTAAEPLVTTAHASRATGVSYHLLRRLVNQGKVPSVTIAGIVRVRLSDIRDAIQTRPASA